MLADEDWLSSMVEQNSKWERQDNLITITIIFNTKTAILLSYFYYEPSVNVEIATNIIVFSNRKNPNLNFEQTTHEKYQSRVPHGKSKAMGSLLIYFL